MYKKAIAFYKTSWPGRILVFSFLLTIAFGFFKASNPELYYEKKSGIVDTTDTNIAYYQRNYEFSMRLKPGGQTLHQTYPIWWYAPHPNTQLLRRGTAVTMFVSSPEDQQMFGIESNGKVIQPAWFDILNAYFNSGTTLSIMICCMLLITIYHYHEVISNIYLWLPYAMGALIISFFSGYLTAVIFILFGLAAIKLLFKKKKPAPADTMVL